MEKEHSWVLESEYKAAKAHSIDTLLIDHKQLQRELGVNPRFTRALRYDYHSKVFNPAKFVRAIASDLRKSGCQIYENSEVV